MGISRGRIDVNRIPAVRNRLMPAPLVEYCMANKRELNPRSEHLEGFSGAAGQCMGTVLMTLNPAKVISVDLLPPDVNKLRYQKKIWDGHKRPMFNSTWRAMDGSPLRRPIRWNIEETHYRNMYWQMRDSEKHLERSIIFELIKLGINKQDVKIGENEHREPVVTFMWAYPGEEAKERIFTFSSGDITHPYQYRGSQRMLLNPGSIDFYYQRAAMNCIDHATRYLPTIGVAVRKFIVISPATAVHYLPGFGGQCRRMLRSQFSLIPGVNEAFEERFAAMKTDPYRWRVELLRRDP